MTKNTTENIITNENYFSSENSFKYMGSSQFKSFMDCEARTLAEIQGKFEREKTTALLVGSYVDAFFSGELDLFKAKNPSIFKKDGCLKSDYIQAEYIIERLMRDELFMKYMSGEHQVIKTGEIAGVPFKIKIDSYHQGKAIVDLKIVRDFDPIYKDGIGRVNFIGAWNYDIQAAIYQEIEHQDSLKNNLNFERLPFFINAATKEKEPDIAIIQIDQDILDIALEIVIEKAPRFQKIKLGEIEPVRCEKCDYCKKTKVLTEIMTIEELNERGSF